jgi:hypothetical protein
VTNNSNEYEEMENAVEDALREATDNILAEEGIHRLTKLEAIQLVHSIEILKMLDELEKQLKDESYSKDYLGGLRHARAEIKERFTKGIR